MSKKMSKKSFWITTRDQKLNLTSFSDELTQHYMRFHWSKSITDASLTKFFFGGGPVFLKSREASTEKKNGPHPSADLELWVATVPWGPHIWGPLVF